MKLSTIMTCCEFNRVDFILGLVNNKRLQRILGVELQQHKEKFQQTVQAARAFKDFHYMTMKRWGHERRVIGKAEYLSQGSNPRFVVTSLTVEAYDAATLYEQKYCARDEMENRKKYNSCICLLIAPVLRRCGPINCGYGFRAWPMCRSMRCGNKVYEDWSLKKLSATRFVKNGSISEQRFALRFAKLGFPSQRLILTRKSFSEC
ncbi:MAG TPA: transposase [Pirellulaceae bacterium]|nr:transposase [Pirellulaceae bacterium]